MSVSFRFFLFFTLINGGKVSHVTSGPQRGRTIPNLTPVRPLRGRQREYVFYPQVPFPSVIPPAVIHIRPLWGRQDSTYESSE